MGPERGLVPSQAALAFAPEFPAGASAALAAASIEIDNVHIVIRRDDRVVVLDTVVSFPAGVDQVSLQASVTVRGSNETFAAEIELRSGTTVLFSGTQQIDARSSVAKPQTVSIPIVYAGPGAKASKVLISARSVTMLAGTTQQLSASVIDAAGAPIADVPLIWSSSDATLLAVSSTGLVTSLNKRGTANVTVKLLSGLTDVIPASVIFPPSVVRVISGAAQSGRAGDALAQPLVLEVDASDASPVAGVSVSLTTSAAGAQIAPTTAVTDASGRVSAAITLGTQAGVQSFSVSAGSLPPLSVSQTATAGSASSFAIASGNAQSDTVNKTLAPFVVRVSDKFGNPIAGTVVTWQRTAGSGALSATSSTTDASGQASITYTLGSQTGSESVSASASGLTTLGFSATTVSRPPSSILASTPSAVQGNVGATLAPLTVLVVNALGQGVANVAVSWTSTGTATLSSPLSSTGADGKASITPTLGSFPGTSIVTAAVGALQVQFTLTATTAAATSIAIAAGDGQSAISGTAVAVKPAIRIKDSFNNPVAGATVTFAVASGGGSITGGTTTTDASGIATVGSWTLGPAGAQTLTATAGSLVATFNATSTSAGPTQIAIVSGNNQVGVAGQALASPMIVEARDAQNNVVSGSPITFTVITGGGSPATQTVNTAANGRAGITLTLGPAGPQSVKACITACAAQVTFNATSVPATFNAVWTGTTSTAWTIATNWSPAVVPASTSNVYVPAGTPNSPVLTGASMVNDLSLQAGATVNTAANQLDVTGSVSASGATITGGGVLRMTGGAAQLAGTVPDLHVDAGSVSLSGATSVVGSVVVQGSATLNIGPATASVSGTFTLPTGSGGRLRMNDPAGRLLVTGAAYFDGSDMGDADLTAGVLELKGNFREDLTYYQGFRAAGTHITRFSGTTAQSIYFYYRADDRSRFQNVEFANPSGITFDTPVVASGNVTVQGTTSLSGGRLNVGGLLTSAAGTSLAALSDAYIYKGTSFPLVSGSAPPVLYLSTGTTVPAPNGTTVYPGSMQIIGSTVLDVGANTLDFSGAMVFQTNTGSRLRMNNAAGKVIVNGLAYFDAADMGDNDLTAGTLELKGDFREDLTFYQGFRATGTHLTRFSGTAQQNVYFYYQADDRSRFQHVEFANPAGVVFSSPVVAAGNITVLGTTALSGGRLYGGAQLTSAATTSLSGLADVFLYKGTAFPLVSGSAPPVLYLSTGTTVPAPSGTTVYPGSMQIIGSTVLDVGANTLDFSGAMVFQTNTGSRLRMNNAAGKVIVNGLAYFDAADMGDNDLTAGTLELKGDFREDLTFYQGFRATGTHLTRFSGSAAQAIYFYYAQPGRSQFQNVEFANGSTSGVSLNSNVIAAGSAVQTGRLAVPSFFAISGALSLGSTSITSVTGSISYGTCTAAPGAALTGFSCTNPQ